MGCNLQHWWGGFPAAKGDDSTYEIQNAKYFVNRMSDVQSLQKHVLGALYKNHSKQHDEAQLRVLLIDRKGTTREWPFAKSTAVMIKKLWGTKVVVEIVSHFEGSLRSQAAKMHWADIVITPHGAQNTNLAFIRPFTSVLELFPHGYYVGGYFQPLVLSAGGVAFDGYPFEKLKTLDTVSSVSTLEGRVNARKGPLNTSPESILRAFPDLVLNNIACRRGLDK